MKQPLQITLPLLLLCACYLALAGCEQAHSTDATAPVVAEPHVVAASAIEAGRYLVAIGGCNDCHTMGYNESNGTLAEEEWLTGVPVGFRGPWGTSYPSNLRLLVQEMPEDTFVEMVKTRSTLPPMPWPSLHHMHEQDIRAIYQYIKSLGPKGERAPVSITETTEPATPYFNFEPLHMERLGTMAQAPAAATPRPPGS